MLIYRSKTVEESLVDLPKSDARERNPQTIASLAADILKRGLLHPITVFERPEGRFEVIAGVTRLLAVRHAGLPEIAIRTLDHEPSASERDLIRYDENVYRTDFTPGEKLDIFVRLQNANKWNQETLAQELGRKPSEISKLFGTADLLVPTLRERFLAGNLAATIAYPLSRVKDAAEQTRLADLYDRGLLDRQGIEAAAARAKKGEGAVRGQKVVIRFSGWTLTLNGPGEMTADSLVEFLKTLERATESARKQGLPVDCIERLLRNRPSAN